MNSALFKNFGLHMFYKRKDILEEMPDFLQRKP